MSNELTIYNNEQVELIKNTVAKGATNSELQMFIEFCKGTKLNPFKREIWFIKSSQGVQMMTGINGFLAIANNNPNFDGMEVEVTEDKGKLISATAKVYRKDRKFPSVGTAYFQEYAKNSPTWRQMPRVMLTKVAKSIALREAFPQELNGMYTEEEMPEEFKAPQVTAEPAPEAFYYYDIKKLEESRQKMAIAWVNSVGLEVTTYQDGRLIVKSNKPLKQLVRCKVTEAEAIGNILVLQAEEVESEETKENIEVEDTKEVEDER